MKLLFDLRMLVRNDPRVLSAAWKHRRWIPPMQRHLGSRKVAEPGDDAVIEGYPRSANTFARDAFAASQKAPVRLATHFHSPAQFFLARQYGIPAMLVLRDPIAAAMSYVVLNEGSYDAEKALRYYVHFHRPLMKITDSFVVAPFEEVTKDFGASIARLNERFGTAFALFDHKDSAQMEIFEAMAERAARKDRVGGKNMKMRVTFPHEEKAKKRAQIAQQFDDPALDGLKATARGYYETLLATVGMKTVAAA